GSSACVCCQPCLLYLDFGFFFFFFFFFNDPATTELYTLSLHDALPIWPARSGRRNPRRRAARRLAHQHGAPAARAGPDVRGTRQDRKSTRLNSSHDQISYAVFCLKKKTKNENPQEQIKTRPQPPRKTRQ